MIHIYLSIYQIIVKPKSKILKSKDHYWVMWKNSKSKMQLYHIKVGSLSKMMKKFFWIRKTTQKLQKLHTFLPSSGRRKEMLFLGLSMGEFSWFKRISSSFYSKKLLLCDRVAFLILVLLSLTLLSNQIIFRIILRI